MPNFRVTLQQLSQVIFNVQLLEVMFSTLVSVIRASKVMVISVMILMSVLINLTPAWMEEIVSILLVVMIVSVQQTI